MPRYKVPAHPISPPKNRLAVSRWLPFLGGWKHTSKQAGLRFPESEQADALSSEYTILTLQPCGIVPGETFKFCVNHVLETKFWELSNEWASASA